jgi:hypothetical protein
VSFGVGHFQAFEADPGGTGRGDRIRRSGRIVTGAAILGVDIACGEVVGLAVIMSG